MELAEDSLINSSWNAVASAFSVGYGGFTNPQYFEKDDFGFNIPNAQLARLHALLEPDLSLSDSTDTNTIANASPYIFSAKSNANSEDNPSYDEAMKGVHQKEYTEAARAELSTLQDDLDCWELVPRPAGKNVLPSTWAFKCKRFPDGRIKKFKARFCARGDCQIEGIDYFDTWSPVVQWTTVRIMMILSCILDLKTTQADITAAFVLAHLNQKDEVYVNQLRGFWAPGTTNRSHVLKLKHALYGLKQSPRCFFQHLSKHLVMHGLKQSSFDHCLFIGHDVIVIVYVDDNLPYAKTNEPIDALITKLQSDFQIRKGDLAAGFLGVDIKSTGAVVLPSCNQV
jgi:hypothetical protein